MQREFITQWSIEQVHAESATMPISRAGFFRNTRAYANEIATNIVIPDDISYDQFLSFVGKKTRVTIEVID